MKRLFLLLISLSAISFCLRAQDLIVTNEGDSINCKITKTTKEYVYFTFMYDNEIRNTLLSVNQISTQQKDYYSQSELPANYVSKNKVVYPHFRFAVDGGWQHRIAKIPSDLSSEWQEHYKKMQSGFHFDVQAAYFFTEALGIEPIYSRQIFSHNLGYGTLNDEYGGIIASGDTDEKITFDYIGVNFISRLYDSNKKNCWLFTFGFGYMGYNDRMIFDGYEKARNTAAAFGSNLSIGYDIGLTKELALGFKLSVMSGSFRNYKQIFNGRTINLTTPDNTLEGLGTVKLSVGLRFNK